MTDYPNISEGDRVESDSGRIGTVAQTSSTQPHIAWIDWDNGERWEIVGTAHLRVIDGESA